jgi:hypothetical protein
MLPNHLRKNLCRVLFLAVLCSFDSFGYFPDSSFLPYADSLFSLDTDEQLTARRRKKDVHTYFMVTTCKTINQPFSLVVSKLREFKSYPEYFTFIMKTTEVEAKRADPATMFVGRYGIYRVYFFGKIREEYTPDSSRYRIFCGGVEQKKYRKAWRKKVRGLIKIGSHDVDIFWTVEKRDDSSCRVSLTASQAFTTKIPNWMVSIGTNRVFKGMLKDLEKYLAKTSPETQGKPVVEEKEAEESMPAESDSTISTSEEPADSTAAPEAEPDSSTAEPETVIDTESEEASESGDAEQPAEPAPEQETGE